METLSLIRRRLELVAALLNVEPVDVGNPYEVGVRRGRTDSVVSLARVAQW